MVLLLSLLFFFIRKQFWFLKKERKPWVTKHWFWNWHFHSLFLCSLLQTKFKNCGNNNKAIIFSIRSNVLPIQVLFRVRKKTFATTFFFVLFSHQAYYKFFISYFPWLFTPINSNGHDYKLLRYKTPSFFGRGWGRKNMSTFKQQS